VAAAEGSVARVVGNEPEESPYITSPIVPPAARAAARVEVPSRQAQQVLDETEDDEDDEDEADEYEDRDDGDDEDEDGDEEDADGADDDDIDDALFNAACGAVEQGAKYTWNELIGALCAAEVDDPRLGLLVGLLVEQDDKGQPLPLTGERVLTVLTDLECDDLVEEAREAAEAGGGDDTPEERAVVRTNAKDIRAQAERELGDAPRARDERRPVKASQLRKPQTALGQSIPVVGKGQKTERRTAR
jgi:hypothetical protein